MWNHKYFQLVYVIFMSFLILNHIVKHIVSLMWFLTKSYVFKRLKMLILIWGPFVHGDQMWWRPFVHGDQLSWGPDVFWDQMNWDHLSIGTKWLWGPSELGTKCVTANFLLQKLLQIISFNQNFENWQILGSWISKL